MRKDQVLILGSGFIGSRLRQAFGCPISERRITCYKDAQEQVRKFSPSVIINCIGHTGANVDDCEKDLDKTLSANAFLPLMLAEAAIRNKIKLVHISSGCIYHFDYSQDSPITEDKTPDYFDLFYSRTKVYSERALEALCADFPVLIVRIRIPLDDRPHPKNILTKLINYRKVIDIPNSLTYIPDFIKALAHLIDIKAKGIYNVVNEGGLRYPQLLEVYKKYVPDFKYEIVDYKQLGLDRTNLILCPDKLRSCGFKVRGIDEVLEECVTSYIKY